jgi:hypothetical protein
VFYSLVSSSKSTSLFSEPESLVHKLETTLNLETDTSEIVNEIIYTVCKAGHVSIVGVYAGFVK